MLMLAGFGARGRWVGVELKLATALVIEVRGEEDGISMALFGVWVFLVSLVVPMMSLLSECCSSVGSTSNFTPLGASRRFGNGPSGVMIEPDC